MNVNQSRNGVGTAAVHNFTGTGSSFAKQSVFNHYITRMEVKILPVYFYIFDNHNSTPLSERKGCRERILPPGIPDYMLTRNFGKSSLISYNGYVRMELQD